MTTVNKSFKVTVEEWNNGLTLKSLRELVDQTFGWPEDMEVRDGSSRVYALTLVEA